MTAYQFGNSATLRDAQEALEGMVDTADLDTIVELLAQVCYAKAEHLQDNWQDRAAAKLWTKAGQRISDAASHKDVMAVS